MLLLSGVHSFHTSQRTYFTNSLDKYRGWNKGTKICNSGIITDQEELIKKNHTFALNRPSMQTYLLI